MFMLLENAHINCTDTSFRSCAFAVERGDKSLPPSDAEGNRNWEWTEMRKPPAAAAEAAIAMWWALYAFDHTELGFVAVAGSPEAFPIGSCLSPYCGNKVCPDDSALAN